MKVFKDSPPDIPRKEPASVFAWAGVGIVMIVAVSLLFSSFLSLHGRMFFATVIGNLGVGWLAMQIKGLRVPYGDISARHVGVAIAGAVALAIAASGLTGMIVEWVLALAEGTGAEAWLAKMSEERERSYKSILLVEHARYIPVVLITVALAPGICEEFFFRGALYEFVRGMSPTTRIGLISFVFALVHFDIYGFIPLLIVGGVFTWLRHVTGGWLVPAVAHVSFNAFNGVVLPRLVDTDEPSRMFLGLAFLLGGLASWGLFHLLPQRVRPD